MLDVRIDSKIAVNFDGTIIPPLAYADDIILLESEDDLNKLLRNCWCEINATAINVDMSKVVQVRNPWIPKTTEQFVV